MQSFGSIYFGNVRLATEVTEENLVFPPMTLVEDKNVALANYFDAKIMRGIMESTYRKERI